MNFLYIKNLMLKVRIMNLQTIMNIKKIKRKYNKSLINKFN